MTLRNRIPLFVVSFVVVSLTIGGIVGQGSPATYHPVALQDNSQQITVFPYSSFSTTNAEVNGSEGILISQASPNGNLWYGPYVERPVGDYRAAFLVNVDTNNTPSLALDVTADNGTEELARETVAATDGWEWVTLNFTLEQSRSSIEFRGFRIGSGIIQFKEVWLLQNGTNVTSRDNDQIIESE